MCIKRIAVTELVLIDQSMSRSVTVRVRYGNRDYRLMLLRGCGIMDMGILQVTKTARSGCFVPFFGATEHWMKVYFPNSVSLARRSNETTRYVLCGGKVVSGWCAGMYT